MPALNVVNGVVALTFGLLAFDEVPGHSTSFVAVQAFEFLAIVAGLGIVAGLEDKEGTTVGSSHVDWRGRLRWHLHLVSGTPESPETPVPTRQILAWCIGETEGRGLAGDVRVWTSASSVTGMVRLP